MPEPAFKPNQPVKITIETDEWIATLEGRVGMGIPAFTITPLIDTSDIFTILPTVKQEIYNYDVSLNLRMIQTNRELGHVRLKDPPDQEEP